ncbi:hypothetical protein VIGAN_11078300, partial [Vigna angularis var. angularis]
TYKPYIFTSKLRSTPKYFRSTSENLRFAQIYNKEFHICTKGCQIYIQESQICTKGSQIYTKGSQIYTKKSQICLPSSLPMRLDLSLAVGGTVNGGGRSCKR